MIEIVVVTLINAPSTRCFDLSLSVDLHVRSTEKTNERVVEGRKSGLLTDGEQITWEAKHFGIRQRLTSQVEQFDRPNRFVSRMLRGAFKEMVHEHLFESTAGVTKMTDRMRITAPMGFLGIFAERFFLQSYMTRFLKARNAVIKAEAEQLSG